MHNIYICVIEFSARRFTDNCSVVPSHQPTGFPLSQRLYSPVEFASQLLGITCHKSSDNCLVYKTFLHSRSVCVCSYRVSDLAEHMFLLLQNIIIRLTDQLSPGIQYTPADFLMLKYDTCRRGRRLISSKLMGITSLY